MTAAASIVAVRLLGGLGNQLFQFAAARAVALRSGLPLRLDITAFRRYTLQRYGLVHFGIEATEATDEELSGLRRGPDVLLRVWPRAAGRHVVVERHFHFDPRLLGIRGPAYIAGYWQSERYFLDVEREIRRELRVTSPPSPENAAMLNVIGSSESVAVHVRRGDYVKNAHTNRQHGTCSLDYYRAGVAEVKKTCRSPHAFVFSDDPAWARANLDLQVETTVVDHNGPDRNYEDLRLMAACRHHIIANSTFSWWGAWLGRKEGQTVVAPRQWFAAARHRTEDLYPSSWRKL